jgi:hypothetical protein
MLDQDSLEDEGRFRAAVGLVHQHHRVAQALAWARLLQYLQAEQVREEALFI